MDFYDNSTPLYSTAQSIYDKLEEILYCEEDGILSEILGDCYDVSNERQGYHYTSEADKLKGRFDEVSDRTNDMWIMDFAVAEIELKNEYTGYDENYTVHEIIYQIISCPNCEIDRKLGFKKLFLDSIFVERKQYIDFCEAWFEIVKESDKIDLYQMQKGLMIVANEFGLNSMVVRAKYQEITHEIIEKIRRGKGYPAAVQVIIESRALCHSYDDFILGLRVNQELYNRQSQQYNAQRKRLELEYEEKLKGLMMIAERVGLLDVLQSELSETPVLAELPE